MLRSSAQGVDPPVCRVLDVAVTYARDSFVDSPAGPFVFSRGAQISWMLLLHMQETVFVDSPAGHLSSRGGGGRQAGIGLTVSSLWHCLGHSRGFLQCHLRRCKVGSFKGKRCRPAMGRPLRPSASF